MKRYLSIVLCILLLSALFLPSCVRFSRFFPNDSDFNTESSMEETSPPETFEPPILPDFDSLPTGTPLIDPVSGLQYRINEDGLGCTIVGCGENDDDYLHIPEFIESYMVTRIFDEAFLENTVLRAVSIPDCVKHIGISSFRACKNLQFVKLGDGLHSLGSHVFSSCKSLTAIELPDLLTQIPYYAFL